MKPKIDPGIGYRLLAVGETLISGDEFLSSDTWFQTEWEGRMVFPDGSTYRRKMQVPVVEPGAGYRLLAVGEVITAGDEFYLTPYARWAPTDWVGRVVAADCYQYRRKVEPLPVHPTCAASSYYTPVVRPPLGLRPRAIAREQRRAEILDAMNRYIGAGQAIPAEWVAEYLELAPQ